MLWNSLLSRLQCTFCINGNYYIGRLAFICIRQKFLLLLQILLRRSYMVMTMAVHWCRACFLELIAREQHPPLDWKAVAEETTVGTVYTKIIYIYLLFCFTFKMLLPIAQFGLEGRSIKVLKPSDRSCCCRSSVWKCCPVSYYIVSCPVRSCTCLPFSAPSILPKHIWGKRFASLESLLFGPKLHETLQRKLCLAYEGVVTNIRITPKYGSPGARAWDTN